MRGDFEIAEDKMVDYMWWLLSLITSSALVGLLIRHITKKSVEYVFNARLQNLKHDQEIELKKIEEKSKQSLEIFKAQIAMELAGLTQISEIERVRFRQEATSRAERIPVLVSHLRRMWLIFQELNMATDADAGMGGLPIDMRRRSNRRTNLIKAFDELAEHIDEFQTGLSDIRIFVQRSNYSFPMFATRCLADWRGGIGKLDAFILTKNQHEQARALYNDDAADLMEAFYEPLFPAAPRQSFNLFQQTWLRTAQQPTPPNAQNS